jgi:hypothetical protein
MSLLSVGAPCVVESGKAVCRYGTMAARSEVGVDLSLRALRPGTGQTFPNQLPVVSIQADVTGGLPGPGGRSGLFGVRILGPGPCSNRLIGHPVIGQTVLGTFAGDHMFGGPKRDTFLAGAGDDCLFGNEGNDVLRAGDGNDRLDGGTGEDVLSGEAGDDRLAGAAGEDGLAGGTGDDRLAGDVGRDVLRGEAGSDRLAGGLGRDVLRGEAGADRLAGGPRRDRLEGGAGADLLNAIDGERDLVRCGPGRDRARVDAVDSVTRCERVRRVPKPKRRR